MPLGIKAKLLGGKDLKTVLAALAGKGLRQAARKGVDDATKLVLAEARARVPARTASLRKALGRKVAAFKSGGGYVGVVGARRDNWKRIARSRADAAAGRRKRPLKARFRRTVKFAGGYITVDPVKYAHLVEFGRRAVRVKKKRALAGGGVVWGVSVAAAPPHPFLRPAWDATRTAARRAIRTRLTEAIRKAGR